MKHSIAIWGYGGMGKWHADRLLQHGDFEISGVWDISPERMALAASDGIRLFSGREELLSSGAETALIALPNHLHLPCALDAVAHGMNVILEKPAVLNEKEMRVLLEAAGAASRAVTVHQNRRWDTDFLAVRQLMESRRLGRIWRLESRVQGSRGIPSGWRRDPLQGGGMLYDWGPHLIDQALCLLGRSGTARVSCRFEHITEKDVDDGFRLLISTGSGADAYLEVTTCNFLSLPRFYVCGEKGTALLSDWRERCRVTEMTVWDESGLAPTSRSAGPTKTMSPRDERTTRSYTLERPEGDSYDFYRAYLRFLEGGGALPVTAEEFLPVLRVTDAAFLSAAAQGKAVEAALSEEVKD